MTRGYLKSSPYFFRIVKVSGALCVVLLLVCAALFPAPLQEPADLARVPNPVKSAWFLLWIQELVSYSKYLIYLVLALAAGMLLLPWLPWQETASEARWCAPGRRAVGGAALAVSVAVLLLTLVAAWFRGENWSFVAPF